MIDDLGGIFTDQVGTGRSNSHPNPFWQFLTGFVPRKLKDLFKVVEWLSNDSPHIYAALQKLSDYSVTELVYDTEGTAAKGRMRELMEETLHLKTVLKACSRDRMIYGNSFVSVYIPFLRLVTCTQCKTKRNILNVDYKFKWKDMSFKWICKACGASVISGLKDLEDRKLSRPKGINIIRWDPKLMDIDYNPITGQSVYYYTIPKDVKQRMMAGNKNLLNTMPIGFITAAKNDKVFKFAQDQLFHMKTEAPAGVDAQWGLTPLIATIKQFYYTAVLRKANEAIALDHVVPFRVITPAQTSGAAEPAFMISQQNWVEEVKDNIKQWRRDPLHIMMSPVALGVTQMGGQGKALMTLGEVEAAENNILAALGVPREFLYGGLSVNSGAVSLRMLENQLLNQTSDLEDLANWLGRKVCKAMSWPEVKMSLTPFKLIDDVQQKSVLIGLNQNGQLISNSTLASVFGYDLVKERKLRMQEAIDEQKFSGELQTKMQRLQNSVSSRARAQAQAGSTGLTYDAQAVIGAADNLVQQMLGLDPSTRRSQLHSLQSEDYVMYSVVVQRLEEAQKQQVNAAKEQTSGGPPQG